jgi:predicted small metal-binding protein
MTIVLDCPCGTRITGDDEDDLVVAANEHLEAAHPGRDYTRDEILFMSYVAPPQRDPAT